MNDICLHFVDARNGLGGNTVIGLEVLPRPQAVHGDASGSADRIGDAPGFAAALDHVTDMGARDLGGIGDLGLAAASLLERGLNVGWMHGFAPTG